MSQVVNSGATLMCSFGTTPSVFTATSAPTIMVGGKPVGNLTDGAAMVNIKPFGMCTTLSNPQVAAATAAALGVLTPQPCIPQTQMWLPTGNLTIMGGKPCLTSDSKCMCMYGGSISVANPGQMMVSVS